MTDKEFLEGFDVLYNNITSNQAPGLNVYEISWFLTKAQSEIVKNHFTANSKGNNIGQGFDDSAKRQADFSMLMKTANCDAAINCLTWYIHSSETSQELDSSEVTVISGATGAEVSWTELPYEPLVINSTGDGRIGFVIKNLQYYIETDWPITEGDTLTASNNDIKIDSRSNVFKYPSDVFLMINEVYKVSGDTLQVVPLKYDAYMSLMSKPFKRPLKNQAWRLINSGDSSDATYTRNVEIIAGPGTDATIGTYTVRYVRKPKPIIVDSLDDLTIDGYCYTGDGGGNIPETSGCELDPSIHDEILQRAVELAKVAWTATGQDNTNEMLQVGQRSE